MHPPETVLDRMGNQQFRPCQSRASPSSRAFLTPASRQKSRWPGRVSLGNFKPPMSGSPSIPSPTSDSDLTLTDTARSAYKGEHLADGEFGKLLKLVADQTIKRGTVLFVEALDRMSRQNPWKANHQLSGLVLAGITVVTTKDDKVYTEKSGIADMILSIVLMASAHDKSEKKSERVKFTKAARVAEAMTTKHVLNMNVPRWLYVADAISSTNRTTRRHELIKRHAATVLAIYQMALHHGAGYITAWLIANGVEPFGRSGKWNIKYVKSLLASRAVLGHLRTRYGLIEDTFPRVIDDDLWLRVQAVREARTGCGGHHMGTWVNLFAGLGRCVTCSGRMRSTRMVTPDASNTAIMSARPAQI